MKKASKLTALFLSFLMVFLSVPVSAMAASAPNIRYVGETDRIGAEYGWTFKFIDGVTTAERFGFTPNPDDYYYLSWDSSGTYVNELPQSDYDICRITDDSQKGNVGEIYHNVGKYQGHTVSLKVTVMDWDKLSAPGTINRADGVGNGKPNYPFISFGLNNFNIDISQYPKIYNAELKYEFFDENTGEVLTVKGHNTFKDIDGTANKDFEYGECVSFSNASELYSIVLSEDTAIGQSANDGSFNAGRSGSCDNEDKTHWIEMLFHSSTLTLRLNSTVNTREGIENTDRGFNHFFFSADTLAPFTTPQITKSADKASISGNGSINYSLDFYLPFVEEKHCYKQIFIIDEFAKILNIREVNIFNDANVNVNRRFDINIEKNKLTVTALNPIDVSMYNTAYTIVIHTAVDCDDYNIFSEYLKNGKCILSNTATITTDAGSNTSNTVSTELTYKLETGITGGTISPSDNAIVPGFDKTITITPNEDYYVSSIIVDGKRIDAAPYKYGGSYSFSNIIANHRIDVVCTPFAYYSINITYVDENGKALAEPYNQSVRAETDYDVVAEVNKEIQYYTLESIEGITEGIVTDNIDIIVHYSHNRGSVTAYYLTDNNEQLADSETIGGYVNEEYQTAPKEFYGYELTQQPDNANGIYLEEPQDVYYIYRLKDTKVIVEYVDTEGNTLADSDIIEGKVFDEYATELKKIDSYVLHSSPENKNGTMTEDTITVIYVYEKEKQPIADEPLNTGKPIKIPNTGADFSKGELNAIAAAAFTFVLIVFGCVVLAAKEMVRRHDENN